MPIEPIAEEFIDVIASFKAELEPQFVALNLPKTVFVIFMPAGFGDEVAGKWKDENVIHINTERLHDIEISCSTSTEVQTRFLFMFLHEVAHFKTLDEAEATEIAKRILFSINRWRAR